MPYLGNVPAEAYTNTVKDSFNGDGSTTAFTLSQPSTTNNLRVVVENVIQDPTVAYTVSGTTLTFTSAPPTGTANIYAVHLGPAVQTAVPPSEINNATTYTSDLTVQGAFTSAGIDDNADATAITIDSSENVFIGTTSGSHKLNVNGSGYFNYTVVDNGGVRNGFSGASGVTFSSTGTRPTNNADVPTDNTYDLGHSSVRWKDLYLSGGVYLGGTGSSNLLDDYEEGTFTPGLKGTSSGNVCTLGNAYGSYTKVGKLVTVNFNISVSSTASASGNIQITGLPFTVAALLPNTGLEASGVSSYWNGWSTAINGVYLGAEENTTICYVYGLTGATSTGGSGYTVAQIGTGQMRGTITYRST